MRKEWLINIGKGGKRPEQELDMVESWLGLHHQAQLGMSEQYQPELRDTVARKLTFWVILVLGEGKRSFPSVARFVDPVADPAPAGP